jgi:phospholipase C
VYSGDFSPRVPFGAKQKLVLLNLVCAVLAFSSCGGLRAANTTGSESSSPSTAPTPAVTLSASPAAITTGQSSTLTWSSTNASSAQIDNNIGTVQPNGTQNVSPTVTTTYTITVTGTSGTATAKATVTVNAPPPPPPPPAPMVTISANPTTITAGSNLPATLTVTATNATTVVITGTDGSSYPLANTGGTQSVTPATTTIYTATATGAMNPPATAAATVTVVPKQPGSINSINHVILMLQENRTFDTYFGMLNPYRKANHWNIGDDGKEYDVDGIDDKLTKFTNQDDEGDSFGLFKFATSCIDDMSSAWLESYGDVSRFDFSSSRNILMDGFVHTAENFAKNTIGGPDPATDLQGRRAMGYYDQNFLNYYYYMASQFAVSDRWFSPVSSKSISNRLATISGGTTQGLVHDPANDDHFPQLALPSIFQELDSANVSWKIYYSVTEDQCLADMDGECNTSNPDKYPATTFTYFAYSQKYLYKNSTGAACTGTTKPSSVVGDTTNSFCIDPNHVAPLTQYFTDLTNGTLPSFAYIEAGYSNNDEHPGNGQSILAGQAQVATVIGKLMASSSWNDSVFFLSYDEGGGPFDHVPPVPGHTNDNTDASLGVTTDIKSVAVNPDSFNPCLANGSVHCDLVSTDPGANSTDAPAQYGFAAQLGFRVPNLIVSPFVRKHYVSHTPMDHTAVIQFVETRFIGNTAHLTARDAAQPNLVEFFDFTNAPWATPPTNIPTPASQSSLGYNPCTPTNLGP